MQENSCILLKQKFIYSKPTNMNLKIKLLFTILPAVYFFASCNNDTTSTATDTKDSATQSSNMGKDTMSKMDNMNMDNGLMAAMNASMDKMSSMKMTGDFDNDFASMMIEHHQGAIDMSEVELKSGKDETLKAMAQKIITAQKAEQDMFRDIVKNSKPMKMEMGKHDELSESMADMKSKMSTMKMTGDTDKDFAMMMTSHHEDAIKMSKDELSHGMNDKLKQMAKKGIADQQKEIGEFKAWMDKNK